MIICSKYVKIFIQGQTVEGVGGYSGNDCVTESRITEGRITEWLKTERRITKGTVE